MGRVQLTNYEISKSSYMMIKQTFLLNLMRAGIKTSFVMGHLSTKIGIYSESYNKLIFSLSKLKCMTESMILTKRYILACLTKTAFLKLFQNIHQCHNYFLLKWERFPEFVTGDIKWRLKSWDGVP
jgi:hypothetical protein